MKQAFAGIAVAALLIAPAFAADIPARMPVKAPAPVVATVYNWTGFYTATGLGGSWWDVEGTYLNGAQIPDSRHNGNATRFNWSSIVGIQYQMGSWVIGVEGAFNSLFGRNFVEVANPTSDCLAGLAGPQSCLTRVSNIWTVGGRLGYAWDRFMVFGSGGYANGRVQTDRRTALGVLADPTSERHGGWYAGGGFEVFVTRFWFSDVIFGAEYQHIDLGNRTHVGLIASADRDMKATVDTVRARLVFKWTPAGPVVARY